MAKFAYNNVVHSSTQQMLQPKPWVYDQGKGVARLQAKKEARELHHMLLGVQRV
jgi:hypothetical protein